MTRSWITASVCALAMACGAETKQGDAADDKPEADAQDKAQAAAAPADGDAFLRALAPLPNDEPVKITYRIEGPGQLRGSLELIAAPGGSRREDWTLRLDADATAGGTEIRSATIETADRIWTGLAGQPGELVTSPKKGLAAAYNKRDPAAREQIAQGLTKWRATLASLREQHPGDVDKLELSGEQIACVRTRVAAQNLCLWEESGLFLRYESAQMKIVATVLERGVKLGPDAFSLPAEARSATLLEAVPLDVEAVLDGLASGDFGPAAMLSTPVLNAPPIHAKKP